MAQDDDTKHRHGSSPVGHLVQRIVTGLQPEDGTIGGSVTRPSGSEPTTTAQVRHELIGQLHGASGSSAVMLGSAPDLTDLTDVLREPVRWMPHSVSGSIEKITRTWDDPTLGYCFEVTGYALVRPLDPEARQDAVRTLQEALKLGKPVEVAAQLRRLQLLVRTFGTEAERHQQIIFYGEQLQRYPLAALELAISDWVRSGERGSYWPALAELIPLVEERERKAKRLLEALR